MLIIPLFRAKKIESDKYVEGFLIKKNYDNQKVRYFILEDKNTEVAMTYEIDSTTLSIHFPDTDIKELFFGLGNGKGASIIEALFIEDNTPLKGVAMHTHYGYVFYDKNDDWVHITKLKDIKVIGIQK